MYKYGLRIKFTNNKSQKSFLEDIYLLDKSDTFISDAVVATCPYPCSLDILPIQHSYNL